MAEIKHGHVPGGAPHSAFADGGKDDRERERIRQLAESLAGETDAPGLARLYQDVLLKRVTAASAAAALDDPDHRRLAYELAVCVCDADGAQSDTERRFLAELKAALGLDVAQTATVEREAEALADAPLESRSRSRPLTRLARSRSDTTQEAGE